jgi:hypothetical protein
MNQPPSWDARGQKDMPQYRGQPTYQGQPYRGQSANQGSPQHRLLPDRQLCPDNSDRNDKGPRPTRHRKRRWVRYAVTSAVIVVVGVIVTVAITSAMNGSYTVPSRQAAVTPRLSAPKAAPPADLVGTGSVLVLTGNRAGEKVAVTLVKVFDHAQAADRFDDLRRGYRLYAVQLRLHDIGSVAYSGSPSKSVVVADSADRSYQSSFSEVTGCRSLAGAERITVGSSRLGCVVFEVPTAARITEIWFTLASGNGAQSGRWEMRSDAN